MSGVIHNLAHLLPVQLVYINIQVQVNTSEFGGLTHNAKQFFFVRNICVHPKRYNIKRENRENTRPKERIFDIVGDAKIVKFPKKVQFFLAI